MGVTVRGQINQLEQHTPAVISSVKTAVPTTAMSRRPSQITQTSLGPGVVWANSDFCWTSVPKNANMVYRSILQNLGVPRVTYQPTHGQTWCIFVIRDPRTRLISALGEHCLRRRVRGRSIKDLLESLLADPGNFDEHLEPQTVWVQGKRYTEILLFEDLYQQTLAHPFFAPHSTVVNRYMNPDRLNNSKHHRGKSLQQLYLDHQDLVDLAIKKYYNKDLDIWKDRKNWTGKEI